MRVDVRGTKGVGLVKRPVYRDDKLRKRVLELEPLERAFLPARIVTPRQITGHWRKARATSNGG